MPLPYGAKVVRGDFAESWRDLLARALPVALQRAAAADPALRAGLPVAPPLTPPPAPACR